MLGTCSEEMTEVPDGIADSPERYSPTAGLTQCLRVFPAPQHRPVTVQHAFTKKTTERVSVAMANDGLRHIHQSVARLVESKRKVGVLASKESLVEAAETPENIPPTRPITAYRTRKRAIQSRFVIVDLNLV